MAQHGQTFGCTSCGTSYDSEPPGAWCPVCRAYAVCNVTPLAPRPAPKPADVSPQPDRVAILDGIAKKLKLWLDAP